MIFGSLEPLESYCAHLLLSKDEIYFTVLETKGSRSLYGPRSTTQVFLYLVFYVIKTNFLVSDSFGCLHSLFLENKLKYQRVNSPNDIMN